MCLVYLTLLPISTITENMENGIINCQSANTVCSTCSFVSRALHHGLI